MLAASSHDKIPEKINRSNMPAMRDFLESYHTLPNLELVKIGVIVMSARTNGDPEGLEPLPTD